MTHPTSHLRLDPHPTGDGRNFLGISKTPEGDMADAELLAEVRRFSIRCDDTEDSGGWVWNHTRSLIAEAQYRGLMNGSALCLARFHAPPGRGWHCMRCGGMVSLRDRDIAMGRC